MSTNSLWNITINITIPGKKAQAWNLQLTADEQTILNMLRSGYTLFEGQIKEMAQLSGTQRPATLIDDALVLLRCLVFNQLKEHQGEHVKISAGAKK